jgi:hypothetical protein
MLWIGTNGCQIKFIAKRNIEQCVLKVYYHINSRRGQSTDDAPSLSISFLHVRLDWIRIMLPGVNTTDLVIW